MKRILFYEGKWYFFSNFSAFGFRWRNRDWMTAEHAYQAAKFDDVIIKNKIRDARSARDAKMIAKKYPDKVRPNWPEIKLGIMEEVVRAKVAQHPHLAEKLLETSDAEIIENSPNDNFWGCGADGNGKNHLGRIWMKLREEYRSKSPA